MAGSYLMDKSVTPDNNILADAIGSTYKFWEELKTTLEKEHGPLIEEWKHYGKTIGWLLKLLYKKKKFVLSCPM